MTDTQAYVSIQPLFPPLQVEYLYDGSFDKIRKVRILDDTAMVILDLTILPYPDVITVPEDGIPPQGSCFFRTTGTTSSIIVNALDIPALPAQSFLEARFINSFIRAVADNTDDQVTTREREKNASDGVRPMYIDRPDIDDQVVAQSVADAIVLQYKKPPLKATAQTYQDGLKSGQTLEKYTSQLDGKEFEPTLTGVTRKIKGGVWIFDLGLEDVIMKTPAEINREIIQRVIGGPLVARKTKIEPEL